MTAAPTVFPTATVPVFMQKTAETPPVQFIDRVVNVPVTAHRQVSLIQRAQKMAEVPQIQFIDKVIDAPVSMQRQVQVQEQSDDTMADTMAAVAMAPQKRV